MVLFSDDIFFIEPGRIRDTKVLKTFVGGKLVYDASAVVKIAQGSIYRKNRKMISGVRNE